MDTHVSVTRHLDSGLGQGSLSFWDEERWCESTEVVVSEGRPRIIKFPTRGNESIGSYEVKCQKRTTHLHFLVYPVTFPRSFGEFTNEVTPEP